jgi:D-glucosaminate-6-phosphate ammonia-lyase
MSIYARWNVAPVINATGTVTRLGGALMSERVVAAMSAAAHESVSIASLQAAASRRIAEITGTEAALVTSGASAALTLGAAAILAGFDLRDQQRLPAGRGLRREFLIARDQRNGYDHAVRLAGARLIDVGCDESTSGAGVRGVELDDYRQELAARQAAGVLYVHRAGGQPPLADLVNAAHDFFVPTLVDAAAELPPRDNLKAIPATGADLVCFSGGKAIAGPQGTGILCGDADLVASAAMQMLDMDDHPELWDPPSELFPRERFDGMPRQGLGRGFKVAKEQIVGLLVALDEFLERDLVAEAAQQRGWLEQIAAQLSGNSLRCGIIDGGHAEVPPSLAIHLIANNTTEGAFDLCRRLRNGTPSIYVGHARLREGVLLANAACLREAQLKPLADALIAVLR